MNKYSRPIGWRNESHRHYLAAKGISSKKYMMTKFFGDVNGQSVSFKNVKELRAHPFKDGDKVAIVGYNGASLHSVDDVKGYVGAARDKLGYSKNVRDKDPVTGKTPSDEWAERRKKADEAYEKVKRLDNPLLTGDAQVRKDLAQDLSPGPEDWGYNEGGSRKDEMDSMKIIGSTWNPEDGHQPVFEGDSDDIDKDIKGVLHSDRKLERERVSRKLTRSVLDKGDEVESLKRRIWDLEMDQANKGFVDSASKEYVRDWHSDRREKIDNLKRQLKELEES